MSLILITGSSSGIGKAIAEKAHKNGYKVVVHGKHDSDELNQVATNLDGSIKAVFDVSDKDMVSQTIDKLIKKNGTIDVLVNNAGVALNRMEDVWESDDEKAFEEYKVNVLGTIHCCQSVIPSMIESKSGSIINIASIKGYPQLSTLSSLTYGASKAGVLSVTKALAKKYSQYGIRVNAVVPGYVGGTKISQTWTDETYKRINEGILLDRTANPKEIANLVMFLASEEASYITGADYLIDGGFSLKGK